MNFIYTEALLAFLNTLFTLNYSWIIHDQYNENHKQALSSIPHSGFCFCCSFLSHKLSSPNSRSLLAFDKRVHKYTPKVLEQMCGSRSQQELQKHFHNFLIFSAPYLPVTLFHTTEILLSLPFKNIRRFTVLYILFWFYMIIQNQETFSLLNSLVSPFLTFPGTLPLISSLTILLQ